jgi:XTP/dITP diphosphohydrolase
VLGPLGVRALTAAEAGAPADFSPEESGATFEENSRIKARALMEAITGAAPPSARVDGIIADDSGLCVDALGGAPGVYSARFADTPPPGDARNCDDSHSSDPILCVKTTATRGDSMEPNDNEKSFCGEGTDVRNNAKLLGLLEGTPYPERAARFVCVITLLLPGDQREGADGATKETVCRGACEGHIITAPRGVGGFGYDPLFVPTESDGRTFAEMPPDAKNAISHRARALAKLYDALLENA